MAFKHLHDNLGGETLRGPFGAEVDRLDLIRVVAALVRRGLRMNEIAATLDMKPVRVRGYIAEASLLGFLEEMRVQESGSKNATAEERRMKDIGVPVARANSTANTHGRVIAAAGAGKSPASRVPNLEQRKVLEHLRDYIVRNWQSRFIPWDRPGDDRRHTKSAAIGFRRDAQISTGHGQSLPGTEFYITADGWNEIFRGQDPVRAGRELMKCGVLVSGNWKRAGKREQQPYTRVTLPMLGRHQCYHVRAWVFELLGDMREKRKKKTST